MGKLQPDRFEVILFSENRVAFFFGYKLLGWMYDLSPGARNGATTKQEHCVRTSQAGAELSTVQIGRIVLQN